MSTEVHMFLAVAQAATAKAYPAGERHPLLIFIQQPQGEDHDWAAAEAVALNAGWNEVDFTKAGTLPAEAANETDEPFRSCYAAALRDGESMMVYAAVVQPAKR